MGLISFLLCNVQDNAIYNLLPDIISRLSDPERGMKEEDFNTIMKSVTHPLIVSTKSSVCL